MGALPMIFQPVKPPSIPPKTHFPLEIMDLRCARTKISPQALQAAAGCRRRPTNKCLRFICSKMYKNGTKIGHIFRFFL